MKKRDLKVLGILSIIFCSLVFIYTGSNNIYGSMTDWVMQHTVFPEYFRTIFYNTGDLIPNFAANIGAGQNAYYFSYYGLLNPFVLLSYLFPFIKMVDYLIIINILVVILSAFLVYKWLINNKYNSRIAMLSSILFLLINCFFHAHRHIMFIDYMPFLILGLMGIDKYFKDKKSMLYILSVFLMIMTSYYYSVGGLLCLVIYGIYKYIKLNKKIVVKDFIIDGIKFLIPMFIGVMMSLVLLIPTLFAILSSRSQVNEVINFKDLLIPNFNFEALLYSNYGMGFTAIAVIALLYVLIFSSGAKRFLSGSILLMLTVPIFMYILNGMLYVRGKVLIPMSPLIILLIAIFLSDLKIKKVDFKKYIIVFLTAIILVLIFNYNEVLFHIDLLITSLGIIIYLWKKKPSIIYASLIAVALVSNISINKTDTFVSKETYNELKSVSVNEMINKINNEDNTLYRMDNLNGKTSLNVNRVYNANYYQTSLYSSTYNPYYKTFYDNEINNAIPFRNKLLTATSNNIMFETLMGIKYVITNEYNIPNGYHLVEGDNKLGIYRNENVLPLGYSTSSLMSLDEYNKLDYPYRSEALLNNIVVDNDVRSNFESEIEKTDLVFELDTYPAIENIDGKYILDLPSKKEFNLKLAELITNKILFISFKLNRAPNCSDGDISITINNVENKLTCKQWLYFNDNYHFEYAISGPEEINELNIILSKGYFEIENIATYLLDYENVTKSLLKVDSFNIKKNNTKGDIIEGSINVRDDGYFIMTIPYDKGFTVYVDGKEQKYELVNKAFIGFPIQEGNHDIKFVYTSPGYDAGVIGSSIGLLLFVGTIILENKRKIYS
ncbi:MAG: YfhO family protein [Bacilli bacterium]|nr:YfhO family protein [Bacilli bacterium]